jgi:DNA-directed RNA polymerase subunit RPC12/RpoP
MQPESYSPPTSLDCPRCGKTSEIDPAAFPMICPECRHTLAATVECARCGERVPYQGDPKAMTTCPKCGADPLAPGGSGTRLKERMGSAAMILAAVATIALLAVTAYILLKRFIPH